MKTEQEVKDSVIKDYIEMRGKDARKDIIYVIFAMIAIIVLVVWAIAMMKMYGLIPSVPVELKTCVTRQFLA